MKTFLKENTPSVPPATGLFGWDLEIGPPETEEGNSGGIELRPIKLFNIRPATQKTEGFLLRATSERFWLLSETFGFFTSLTP